MRGAGRTVAVLMAAAAPLAACGGGSDRGAEPAATATTTMAAGETTAPARARPRPPRPAPLPGLPADLAGFTGWTRANTAPIPPDSADARRVGLDAHRSTKQVHVNAVGERRLGGGPFSDGSVVVKAGRVDGVLVLVAVMRKVAGSDGEHGDWRFREFLRDGAGERFSTRPSLTGETCWSCHALAEPTDWVFTRSRR